MASSSAGERLQKVLARLGFGSRREVEAWIRAGRLAVNGTAAELGQRVNARDHISLDGRPLRRRETAGLQAYLCHRSPGDELREPLDSAAPDEGERLAERAPLIQSLPRRAGRRFIAVSPMPHIDGGLELVTSDGELAARLQRAVRNLPGGFSVRVHGELAESQLQAILEGTLDSGVRVAIERCEASGGAASNRWYEVLARGASGRDVRQLFERQGALVSRVLRTRLGTLLLERSLPRGRFRLLSAAELDALTGAPQPESPAASAAAGVAARRPPPAGAPEGGRARGARAARVAPRAPRRFTRDSPRNSGPSRRGSPGRAARGKGR
jgi:23S rRNA pseudouridine2605 synthase